MFLTELQAHSGGQFFLNPSLRFKKLPHYRKNVIRIVLNPLWGSSSTATERDGDVLNLIYFERCTASTVHLVHRIVWHTNIVI